MEKGQHSGKYPGMSGNSHQRRKQRRAPLKAKHQEELRKLREASAERKGK